MDVIDERYLPYSAEQLLEHFIETTARPAATEAPQVKPYLASAAAYHAYLAQYPDRRGVPIEISKRPAQIEKDERFWVAATMLRLFHTGDGRAALASLLAEAIPTPPAGGSWPDALSGDLRLYFEVALPAPAAYRRWLRGTVHERALIPYIRHAALKPGADEPRANLEGATRVDALLLNAGTGLCVLVEAKTLSDVSGAISYDQLRNQLTRNVDVMLEPPSRAARPPLDRRKPDLSCLLLLTPRIFRDNPHARLYGRLMHEYRDRPETIARDLPHRGDADWHAVASRLGWLTYEECEEALPGCCPWLTA
jgi:hypothetical protein